MTETHDRETSEEKTVEIPRYLLAPPSLMFGVSILTGYSITVSDARSMSTESEAK